jgi:hypothetical protein
MDIYVHNGNQTAMDIYVHSGSERVNLRVYHRLYVCCFRLLVWFMLHFLSCISTSCILVVGRISNWFRLVFSFYLKEQFFCLSDQPGHGFLAPTCLLGSATGMDFSLVDACWDQPQACLCGTLLGSARSATMYVSHRQVFILLVGRSIVVRINNLDFTFPLAVRVDKKE